MGNPRSVSRFFLKYALLLLGTTVVILAALQTWNEISRVNADLRQLETSYLESRQFQLKRTIQGVLHIIHFHRQQASEQTRQTLLHLAKQACQLMKRDNQAKWLPALNPPPGITVAIYDQRSGRLVARTGTHASLPDLADILKASDGSSGSPVIRELTAEGRQYQIALVSPASPWICVAVADEITCTKQLQRNVLKEIAAIRFGPEGYVFVNTFDGIPLIRDGELVSNGTSMWELTDPNGIKVIQEEYRVAQKPDGGFIYYSWRRLSSMEVCRKMSYIAGDQKWKWIIGTGLYLDDLKPALQQRKEATLVSLRQQLVRVLGLFVIMIAAIVALSLRFRRKLNREFQVFSRFFHRTVEKGQPIQLDRLAYREFRELASQANTMLEKQQTLLAEREKSEAKFRTLFEQSSDAMSILSDQRFIDCNRALMNMFGAKQKEDLMVHPVQLSPEFQPDGSRSDEKAEWMIRHAMETGHHRFEWLHRRLDGTEIWCEIMLTRIPWNGEDCLFVVWRDISDRKKVELALRQNEARLRKSQVMAKVGHWELDLDTQLYEGSEVLYDIYGYEDVSAPVEAERIVQSVAPEDRHRVAEELKNLITRDQPFDTIFRIVRETDGEIRYVHSSAEAVRDDSGRCRKVIGVVQDITDLKKMELTALSERERMRTVIDSIAEAVIVTEPDTRIIQLNPVAESLLNMQEEQAKGKLLLDVLCLQPTDESVEQDTKDMFTFPGNAELIRSDGSRRQVLISSSTFELTKGKVAGIVLVIRDVTELRQMQRELQKTQRLESLGYLAGGIAHDFNNQLTGITAALSLAKEKLDRNSPVKSLLDKAERAAVQCRTLTGQLLTFARGGEPIITPVDLGDLLNECISVASSGTGIDLISDIPPSLPPVLGDRGQLHQVFTNILINAVQATSGSGRIQVAALSAGTSGGHGHAITITIADNGPGIPNDVLPHIFDPFFTTKKEGTGLGLSTAFSIIQRHHGTLTVDSGPRQGTTVRITLPASTDIPVPQESNVEPKAPEGLRILLMDDEAMIRDLARELFEFLGHEITITADGKDAVESYRNAMTSRPFDVVFLDITVPGGMGGKETMALLKELDPEATGIVMSGYAKDPLLADPQAYGFSGRLAKPFKLDELREVLTTVMQNNKHRK